MRRFILPLLAAGSAIIAMAGDHSALSLADRMTLHAERMGISADAARVDDITVPLRRASRQAAADKMLPTFVRLTPGADISDLVAAGAHITARRGDIVLCTVAMSRIEDIAALPSVARVALSRSVKPKLDRVRTAIGADKIHAGDDLPQAYTGRGVLAGIVDNGFDPNHSAFLDDDGHSRMDYFIFVAEDNSGEITIEGYEGDDALAVATDNNGTFHGSHTLNIMAGSRGRSIKAAQIDPDNIAAASTTDIENPYYGIAYDARLAVGSCELNDYYIANAMEELAGYAYYYGKPMVINLSLGSNIGPHDGTQTMNRYLDLFTQETGIPVCIAAGNEGDLPIVLTKTLTDDDNTAACFIKPDAVAGTRYGQVQVYSSDDTPFTFEVIIYNTSRNQIVENFVADPNAGEEGVWYVGTATYEGDISNSILRKYFGEKSYIGLGAGYDPDNGRYYGLMSIYGVDTDANLNEKYIIGFKVTGSAGQRIDAYGDGFYQVLSSYGKDGYDEPTCDGTLSDMACGHNAIVVGAWTTRERWPLIGGTTESYGFTEGEVSPFSSWGTLIDGRSLPDVCAPGASVISACNYYYAINSQLNINVNKEMSAQLTRGARTDYYTQAIGSSMSTPAVSGAIATWLEADPSLTCDKAKDIIRRTAIVDDDVRAGNPVQWGTGKFDAYAGLKEVIATLGVNDIAVNDRANALTIVADGNGCYRVLADGADGFEATVFSVSGARVISAACSEGTELSLDCSALTPGIYVVSVNGAGASRIAVR